MLTCVHFLQGCAPLQQIPPSKYQSHTIILSVSKSNPTERCAQCEVIDTRVSEFVGELYYSKVSYYTLFVESPGRGAALEIAPGFFRL